MTAGDRFAADPHRPRYHFAAPANWMNDPNGLIQWKGAYHLFYQHNPNGPFWGTMHWGHAVSRDLLRWAHLPIALAPDMPYDKDGCYSGCAVDNGGVPAILYTGTKPQVQCLATGDGDLVRWTKHAANPVIAQPPPGIGVNAFRDPMVWREGQEWLMAVGAATEEKEPRVLLYRSRDLVTWEYLHPLLTWDAAMPAPVGTARMWECPSFFPLGNRHVLLLSCIRRDDTAPVLRTAYMVGRYRDRRFRPESFHTFDFGSDLYAPATMQDDKGRRLLWGWIGCGRSGEAQKRAGWSGIMSLPMELLPREDGCIGMRPVEELKALRGPGRSFGPMPLELEKELLRGEIQGDMLELDGSFEVAPGASVTLKLRVSPDDAERTLVTYDDRAGRLTLDRRQASLDATSHGGVCGDDFRLRHGEALRLRVFVDKSVIEIFANDRARLTSRVFPSRADSVDVAVSGHGRMTKMDVWELAATGTL